MFIREMIRFGVYVFVFNYHDTRSKLLSLSQGARHLLIMKRLIVGEVISKQHETCLRNVSTRIWLQTNRTLSYLIQTILYKSHAGKIKAILISFLLPNLSQFTSQRYLNYEGYLLLLQTHTQKIRFTIAYNQRSFITNNKTY